MSSQLQRSRDFACRHQGGKCYYCTVTMRPSSAPLRDLLRCTAEHLLPRCEGGTDARDNIGAACARCNHSRHMRKRPPAVAAYREEVQRRVARGRWHDAWEFERGLLDWPRRRAPML